MKVIHYIGFDVHNESGLVGAAHRDVVQLIKKLQTARLAHRDYPLCPLLE